MKNLQYEIIICQKSHNDNVKLLRNSMNQAFALISNINNFYQLILQIVMIRLIKTYTVIKIWQQLRSPVVENPSFLNLPCMDMITHVADKKKHKKPRVAKKKNGKKIEIFCEIQVVYVLLFNYSTSSLYY